MVDIGCMGVMGGDMVDIIVGSVAEVRVASAEEHWGDLNVI